TTTSSRCIGRRTPNTVTPPRAYWTLANSAPASPAPGGGNVSRSSPVWPALPRVLLYYAVAVLAVAAAVLAGLAVDRFLEAAPFVSLFLCAVLLAAWLGGAGPGLFATGLSILAFDYFFIPPVHSLIVGSEGCCGSRFSRSRP